MNHRNKFAPLANRIACGMRLLNLFAVALLLITAAQAQSGGLRFKLTDLEIRLVPKNSKTVPTLSVAYAINDSGQITGDIVYGNNQYCFTYTNPATTGSTFTSTAATTLWCNARAINSTGWITGGIYMPNAGLINAFLRSPSSGKIWNFPSTFSRPGEIPFNSFGWGIDDSLNVVGEMDAYYPSSGYVDHAAYSWNSAGTPVPSIFSPLDTYSQELATSESGAYVAFFDSREDSQPILLPENLYLNAYCNDWEQGGSIDPAFAIPYAVNNQGHAAGSSFCGDLIPNDPYYHATFWGSQGVVDLGFEPSTAYAISSDDWVVGHSDAWAGGIAFLRVSDPNCPTMVNLNTLLDAASTGWKVKQAYGTNTSHQIVGQASDSTGRLHAVLLTPDNKQSACVY